MTPGLSPPDATLMERLAQGDEHALESLYERYGRVIFSLVFRITQQRASAEELTQDVFLQLWRNARQYQAERGPLAPWLFTLARSRALDMLRLKREQQRKREDPLDSGMAAVATAALEVELDVARRAQQVRTVMRELPEKERQAIELAFFDGMTHSEISAHLSQPLGTVKSWIRNGLSRLKSGLSAPGNSRMERGAGA